MAHFIQYEQDYPNTLRLPSDYMTELYGVPVPEAYGVVAHRWLNDSSKLKKHLTQGTAQFLKYVFGEIQDAGKPYFITIVKGREYLRAVPVELKRAENSHLLAPEE